MWLSNGFRSRRATLFNTCVTCQGDFVKTWGTLTSNFFLISKVNCWHKLLPFAAISGVSRNSLVSPSPSNSASHWPELVCWEDIWVILSTHSSVSEDKWENNRVHEQSGELTLFHRCIWRSFLQAEFKVRWCLSVLQPLNNLLGFITGERCPLILLLFCFFLSFSESLDVEMCRFRLGPVTSNFSDSFKERNDHNFFFLSLLIHLELLVFIHILMRITKFNK